MQRLFYILFLLIFSFVCFAYGEVPLTRPDLSQPTKIAPAYFGPNALPVPDMLDGEMHDKIYMEIAGDYFYGFRKDQTADVFAKLVFPLFTRRVNLSVWMPVVEWYANTSESLQAQRLPDSVAIYGKEYGDVYVTTDILLLEQERMAVDWVLRTGIKTASGGSFDKARYFDNPGYFFDTSLARSIFFKSSFFKEIRFAASAGFLCWQTDNGRQNDAVMYGLQVKLNTSLLSVSETFGGYTGWESDGDIPMTLKTRLAFHLGDFEPFACYQYGLRDYPYHQLRIGLAYRLSWAPIKMYDAVKK